MGLVNEVRWSPKVTAMMEKVPPEKTGEANRNLYVAALQAAHATMLKGPSRTGRYKGTFLAGNQNGAVACVAMVDARNHIMVIKMKDETWRAY